MNMNLSMRDGISTEEIHQILIKSASDLISEAAPNYQYVAARLLNMSLRKIVWKSCTPPNLHDHICIMCDNGIYDNEMIDNWSKEEVENGKYGRYVDIQSLYPTTQFYDKLPYGLPEWINFEEKTINVEF